MKGCLCVTAASGNEALNVIKKGGEFDFALMDMHMPGRDGASPLKAIRSNPRTAKLKVFSVSGSSPAEFGAIIGGDGFDGWLPKPLNPATLCNHIQESLRRERE
jgi:CheY-like chemotaxis protein